MFLWNGEVVELDRSEIIFSDRPGNQKTYDYVVRVERLPETAKPGQRLTTGAAAEVEGASSTGVTLV